MKKRAAKPVTPAAAPPAKEVRLTSEENEHLLALYENRRLAQELLETSELARRVREADRKFTERMAQLAEKYGLPSRRFDVMGDGLVRPLLEES